MKQSIAKKFSYKNIGRICLFATLPLIDLWRNVGNGWQMMLASQSVGLVMALVVVMHYGIRKFVKWHNIIWLCGAGVAIATMPYWFGDEAIKYHYLYEMRLALVTMAIYGMILIQIICDYREQGNSDKKIRVNKIGIVLWGIWLLYILLATLMKDNTYRPEFDLLYFGIFYLVIYSKEEQGKLLEDLANGILVGFLVLQSIAFLFRPYVEGISRYRGMYFNSNMFNLMCLVVLCLVLVKITYTRRIYGMRHWSYWGWIAYYGVVFSLILLSIGRISIILAIGGTILYGLCMMYCERIKIKKMLVQLVVIVLSICMMLPIVFAGASYLPRILKRPILFQDEYFYIGDLHDEDNYVSYKEFIKLTLGRFGKLVMDYSAKDMGKEEAIDEAVEENYVNAKPQDPNWENKTYYLNSEGYNALDLRVAIWRTYLDEVNMWGHTTDEWLVWVTPNLYFVHAHNIFIMQAYVYGLMTGCVFVLWILAYIHRAWCYWRRNANDCYAIIPLMAATILISFGMFELNWMSGQISWVLILITQKCLIEVNVHKSKE